MYFLEQSFNYTTGIDGYDYDDDVYYDNNDNNTGWWFLFILLF